MTSQALRHLLHEMPAESIGYRRAAGNGNHSETRPTPNRETIPPDVSTVVQVLGQWSYVEELRLTSFGGIPKSGLALFFARLRCRPTGAVHDATPGAQFPHQVLGKACDRAARFAVGTVRTLLSKGTRMFTSSGVTRCRGQCWRTEGESRIS